MLALQNFKFKLAALLCAATLTAYGSNNDLSYAPLELNIAHINDHHSQLEPFALQELTLNGVATQAVVVNKDGRSFLLPVLN